MQVKHVWIETITGRRGPTAFALTSKQLDPNKMLPYSPLNAEIVVDARAENSSHESVILLRELPFRLTSIIADTKMIEDRPFLFVVNLSDQSSCK